MATTPPVNLGYDKPSEATLDQVNTWMRSRPWYQDLMAAWGQDPGHPTLTKAQSQQVLQAAQAEGVVVDEGDMEVDNHGNFNPKGHKLRNTLIVAGIAGATLATLGAAGAFAGAAAAPEIGITSTPAVLGGTAAGAGATTAAATTAAATSGAAGLTGAAGAAGAAGVTSKVADLFGGLGSAIGGATSAAGDDRRYQENAALLANGQNINGLSLMERALMERAAAERTERSGAAVDVARADHVANPRVGPFNPAGPPVHSDQFRSVTSALGDQGAARLTAGPQYSTNTLKPVPVYTPLDIRNVQGATGTNKGALERVGDWAGPGLSLTGRVIRLLRK